LSAFLILSASCQSIDNQIKVNGGQTGVTCSFLGTTMLGHLHFAVAAGWLSLAIAGLLWVMACAITSNKMEREGVTFWKSFITCFLLTPLVGVMVIGVARSMRPNRPLVQTVTRS
jgi:hypothetical protein